LSNKLPRHASRFAAFVSLTSIRIPRLRASSSCLLPSKSHPVPFSRFACVGPVCVFEELIGHFIQTCSEMQHSSAPKKLLPAPASIWFSFHTNNLPVFSTYIILIWLLKRFRICVFYTSGVHFIQHKSCRVQNAVRQDFPCRRRCLSYRKDSLS
jgi:hypothetical protein